MRGCHANKDSEFLMFCLQGSCRVRVDNGKIQSEVALNSPNTALYLEKMVWKEMFDFSNDTVLVVLTNTLYNKKEYVKDYEVFIKGYKLGLLKYIQKKIERHKNRVFIKKVSKSMQKYTGLTDSEKKSSISATVDYPKFCELATKDDEVFKNFRRHPSYTLVLEPSDYENGKEYLKIAKDSFTLNDFENFKRNDSIGNPMLFEFEEVNNISLSTARYIKVLHDLIAHFGNLNNLKICEIAIGYGGQARLIFAKFPQVASYTFVDLQCVLNLSKKYLSHFNDIQAKMDFQTSDSLYKNNYDLIISNYGFSELSRAIQDIYLDKIINHSKHGYITYGAFNDVFDTEFAAYKIDEYSKIIHKDIRILEEKPLLHPMNKIVVW